MAVDESRHKQFARITDRMFRHQVAVGRTWPYGFNLAVGYHDECIADKAYAFLRVVIERVGRERKRIGTNAETSCGGCIIMLRVVNISHLA